MAKVRRKTARRSVKFRPVPALGPSADRTSPSKRTMRANNVIAGLLNRWLNDKRFQRPDGTPRVLSTSSISLDVFQNDGNLG